MMYFEGIDELGLGMVVLFAFALVLLVGIPALAIAWGGRRVGMSIGALGLVVGLGGLGILLDNAPQLWWIAVIPIGIGAATLRAWYHHSGPATAQRLRLDLRGLLALTLFLALILGGITSQYRQMRIEEGIATRIESLPGGSGNNFVRWRFGRVHGAYFLAALDPAEFEKIADDLERLSHLQKLQVNGAKLPGRVTQRLGRLTTLRTLLLQHTPLGDDDLSPLENLQNLEILELEANQITDAGLVHLRSLKRLRVLNLYRPSQITPAAMTNLRSGLPRLDNP
jgi:hypothetical protein